MIKVSGNRLFQAIIKLMWFSAFIHMVLLFLHAALFVSLSKFSFFDIIGVGLFFPSFVASFEGVILSGITLVVVFGVIYFFFTDENRRFR